MEAKGVRKVEELVGIESDIKGASNILLPHHHSGEIS
jgi:hypothetical protein